ncbi:ComEA family DNA-binding protein [Seonamhaeicola marinus]|uniref:Helix-hairpin-helix domain-containing protein n=1 Tax=Seonamhaeicola marinus TaxID=1912246 RepID=A0A5D0IWN8_9FLAO|nr:helix-hairpin-helix domain-containing protein [Seonamhaeicola marinus]TYA86767.1 helix-hairpin-helix domain-containing protein [Seonamhaeicola marinus]
MKSHFMFTKKQRNGIFLLVVLILILQTIYFLIDFSSTEIIVNEQKLAQFNKEIDSLRNIEIESRKPKMFPFNPNYITDYKGAVLGMSTKEIDRLFAYRAKGKWINSSLQFQEVTKVSDSLLSRISPYFKFPDFREKNKAKRAANNLKSAQPKTYSQKLDLNKATAQQLQIVNGVGKVLSQRIIRFRNTFIGGFIADVQLKDVYGLTPELIELILSDFTVNTPRSVKKINLNEATVEELVTIQHIDYDLAANIIEERVLREGINSMTELSKVKGFPINKIEIIELYLCFH